MSAEILARWQFGITTVYHYFFVPVTIALSMLVAILQTMWFKTGQEKYLRLTKFYGKLFLINFAMGVVTGIVQEFQFGMNWSEYSRFVGDVFGAPLALEALLAFFLESTFLGMWIFGWDRLNKKVHLAAIWLAAIGTLISAIFILAANAWMQNPVGAKFNPATGRAELENFSALLTNPVFLTRFTHTITAAWMVATAFVAGVAGWHLAKIAREKKIAHIDEADEATKKDISAYRYALKFGAIGLIVSGALVMLTGDWQGKVMTTVEPMKMAAAEGLLETPKQGEGAPFTAIAWFGPNGEKVMSAVEIPNLFSFLATGDFKGKVYGINDLNKSFTNTYAGTGALDKNIHVTPLQEQYKASGELQKMTVNRTMWNPNLNVTFWSFRIMIAMGLLAMLFGVLMLVAVRKGKLPKPSSWWTCMMVLTPLLPLFANSFGWIFTEMGRQPWIVHGVLPTISAVSPTVTAGEVLFSMILFTLVYGAFAVVEVGLMLKYIKKGMPEAAPVELKKDEETPLSFAY